MAKIAIQQTKTNSNNRVKSIQKTIQDDTAQIEKLAYQFFLERGGEHGHDQEDWARAESQLRNRKKL